MTPPLRLLPQPSTRRGLALDLCAYLTQAWLEEGRPREARRLLGAVYGIAAGLREEITRRGSL